MMGTPSLTIAGLRAIAQSIADEAQHQIDGAGVGPLADAAYLELATCHAVIAVIDLYGAASQRAPGIPPRLKRSLDDYAAFGLRTGDCLYAVLTNNMRAAFMRADAETAAAMPAIMTYVCCSLPAECWGDVAAVEAWIRKVRS